MFAAFATAALAKSVNSSVDAFCLLERAGGPRDYSARALADAVVAPNRSQLRIDLGANRANPLNNTPFIHKTSIREITVVRNKVGWAEFVRLMHALDAVESVEVARDILRAFIIVRRRALIPEVPVPNGAGEGIVPSDIATLIRRYIDGDSEDGRRAQSCAAALFDCAFGPERVKAGIVHDPSRSAPLDVAIVGPAGEFLLACEVKDKPVGEDSIRSSVEQTVLNFDVKNVVYLAISQSQSDIGLHALQLWALRHGVHLHILTRIEDLVMSAAAFYTGSASFGRFVAERVVARSREIEVSSQGIQAFVRSLEDWVRVD